MIYDILDNAELYYSVNPLFKDAFGFLKTFDYTQYSQNTKINLIEGKLRAGVDFYKTVSSDSKKWEAHENYIDIQCVYKGREKCGVIPRSDLTVTDSYNPEKDVMFFKEKPGSTGIFTDLIPGRFAVFFPNDAHKPGIHTESGADSEVMKVVVKIIFEAD